MSALKTSIIHAFVELLVSFFLEHNTHNTYFPETFCVDSNNPEGLQSRVFSQMTTHGFLDIRQRNIW